MEGDGKNLGTLDISIREAPGPPTLSIMVIYVFTYKYKHKSSFLQNHYPFVSFSFHATSRLPSAPAHSKELEIINTTFPPDISFNSGD